MSQRYSPLNGARKYTGLPLHKQASFLLAHDILPNDWRCLAVRDAWP